MSKTKRSLSLIAGLSLVGTSLVAAPAQAANEITLDVAAGSGNTTILGEAFALRATVSSTLTSAAYPDVKFEVTNSTNATLTYGMDNTNASAANTTSVTVDGAAGSTSTGTSDVIADTGAGAIKNQLLSIKSAATVGHSVTVVAWIDDDGDSVIDSGEYKSGTYTVNFVTVANAGLVASYVTNPQVGDTTVSAKITSSVINVAQVAAANFGIQFGVYTGATLGANTDADGDGNTTSDAWTLSTGVIALYGENVTLNATTAASLDALAFPVEANIAASKSYVLRGIYSKDAGTTAWAAFGTADTRATGAVSANAANSSVVITANNNVTTGGIVRKGYTGDVVYTVEVLDVDEEPVSGVTVRLTTLGAGTDATGTLKINGTTVSETANQTHDATTNASGIATFTVTNNEGSTTDLLDVSTITAEGVTISADATNLDWNAASYTLKDVSATAAANVVRAVASGASHTFTFRALDQWSQPLTAADARVSASATTRTVGTYTDTFEDGSATITVPDGALSTGDTTVTLTLQELNSGVWGALVDYTIAGVGPYTIKYYSQTDAVTITANNGTTSDLAASQTRVTTKEWNTELNHLVAAVSTFDAGATPGTTLDDETVTISGSVVNASTLVAKGGALITVSGDASILFVVGNVAKFGSITFYDDDGAYSVNAYSNKVLSSSTVTVTSGAASKTAKVSFSAGETNVGSAITFTGPTTANAGDAIQVVANLKDKFGNAVDTDITASDFNGDADTTDAGETSAQFSVTVTGPGVTLVSMPTATDANGQAYISRLLGSNDTTGTITVTVTYGGADGVIGTGLDDVSASYTITVGAAASTGKVNVGSFNGKLVVYASGLNGARISWKVGGNWGSQVATSNYAIFNRPTPRAGVTLNVEIFVNGVSKLTKSVVTR